MPSWNEPQWKVSGKDAYVVVEGNNYYMVNIDETTGYPIGYVAKKDSLVKGSSPLAKPEQGQSPSLQDSLRLSGRVPVTKGGIDGSTSSPSIPQSEKRGGIDFVNINLICQPMGNFSGLSLQLPQIADIENFNFADKLSQIKNLLRAEQVPNGQRFEELLAACSALKAQEAFLGDIVSSMLESCRVEEELALESSPETREAILLAEAM